MPGYKGHLVGGSLAFALLLFIIDRGQITGPATIEWFVCALAGALFPDIDTKSKGQKLFYWLLLIIFIVLMGQQRMALFSMLSITSLAPMLVSHRGLFHRLWFVVAVPLLAVLGISVYLPAYSYMLFFDAAFFSAGAISHLWLDLGLRRMLRL